MIIYKSRPFISALSSRRRLTGPTTFFVRPDGSNTSNRSGRSNTAADAWAEPAYAVNYIKQYIDLCGFTATIDVAAGGTYTMPLSVRGAFVGEGDAPPIAIMGDINTPIAWTTTGANLWRIERCSIRIWGFDLNTVTAGSGAILFDHATLYHAYNRYGNIHDEVLVPNGHSRIEAEGPTTTYGDAASWCHCTEDSDITFENQAVAFATNPLTSAPPKFAVYLAGVNKGRVSLARSTITGTVGGDGTHFSQLFAHIDGAINLAASTGSDGLFARQIPLEFDNGGLLVQESAQNNFYVRTSALNNNIDGFRDNDARAFKDIFAAINATCLRPWDQTNQPIPMINLAAGTYTATNTLINAIAAKEIIIVGDEVNPGNVIIQTTNECFAASGISTLWNIRGVTLISSSNSLLSASNGATICFQNVIFGNCGNTGSSSQLLVAMGGTIRSTGPYVVDGGGTAFLRNVGGIAEITTAGTFQGTHAYSTAAVVGDKGGNTRFDGAKTISGTYTGTRLSLINGARLDLNGAGQSALPGDVDGTVDSGTFAQLI